MVTMVYMAKKSRQKNLTLPVWMDGDIRVAAERLSEAMGYTVTQSQLCANVIMDCLCQDLPQQIGLYNRGGQKIADRAIRLAGQKGGAGYEVLADPGRVALQPQPADGTPVRKKKKKTKGAKKSA